MNLNNLLYMISLYSINLFFDLTFFFAFLLGKFLYSTFVYLFLSISLIFNILLFVRQKKEKKSLLKSVNNYKKQFEEQKSIIERLTEEKKRLNNNLNSIENSTISINEKNEDKLIKKIPEETIPIAPKEKFYDDEVSKTIDLKISNPKIIFLPSPFEEKRFSIEDVKNEQTSSSLYKIVLDSSNIVGEIFILEDADFTRALNSPELFLEKACIYENTFNATAKGIKLIESGKAKLENRDWLITEKIKIKFI